MRRVVANPFQLDGAQFLALVNSDGEYSLWPAQIAVPDGWSITFGAADRRACLDFINQNWPDMQAK
ncbi:MbtH family protein [Streptomyces rhizosphaericus]|uniref:MbtH family protein n=1 Tax=Streptomyces rhizosphaericus TaxID=114699 RepID=A0A6G4AEJ4_9ACTN|nr:MbtH family protein [Streptomyces rhizosphaericus]NEW71109.1 MbtH family protein [Streptomyces rhizosphaericus]